ncbi:MAG: RidA family protein [Clostridiales bacterium]|nr:RidA family protein [Clostridiales bacterium]
MDVDVRMKEIGIELPKAPATGGVYAQAKEFGQGLIYISGCVPTIDGKSPLGKLGAEISLEQGQECAKNAMLNVLAVLEKKIGDLNKVKNAVKILVFVAGTDEFYQHPQVANGGSQLLVDIFGEDIGAPSRSAIGVNALPGNVPVEIEALFEVI